MMRFEEFKQLNESVGNHFFDNGRVQFLKGRILEWDNITGYFVTSEKNGDLPRAYTIRKANFQTGDVKTVSEYGQYNNLNKTKVAFKRLLKKGV